MRKLALAALALLPLTAFGCTAILGDFEVSATGGPGTPDGSTTDGTTTEDGSTDGPIDGGDTDAFDAQSLVFTTCGISNVRTIDKLADPTMTMGFRGRLEVIRVGTSVRVVAQKPGGDGAVVYSFNPQQNGSSGPLPTPTIVDLHSAGRYIAARHVVDRVALLFVARDAAGGPLVRMSVFEIKDNDPTVANPVTVSAEFEYPNSFTGAGGNITGSLGVYPNSIGEYFWAIGGVPSATVGGQYDLLAGHFVPSRNLLPPPVRIHTTSDDREVRIRDMARSQTTQYLFNDRGPDGPNDKGSSFFVVPQDPTAPSAPRSLAPATSTKPWVAFGLSPGPMGDGIRAAVAEVDFSSTNFGVVRAGTVPQSELTAAFDGSKIPMAFSLTSLSDVPAEGEAHFFGDDLLWMGSPPDPLRGKGLNFIWYNTQQRVIRAKQTANNRLVIDRTGITGSAVFLDTVTAVNADADVVFTENANGESSLQYGRLSCIR